MKSIDKLRDLADDINAKEIVEHMQLYPNCVFDCHWLDGWHSEFNRLIESLEAEIAANYLELPKDADGVPIHVGDVVYTKVTGEFTPVGGIGAGRVWFMNHGQADFDACNNVHHVKHRTLEYIVADAIQYCHNGITGDRNEGKVAEFCAEIRELLLGGEGDKS